MPARVIAAFREHVGDRASDAWGLLLILIAVIAALGTWVDAAGAFPDMPFLDGYVGNVFYGGPVARGKPAAGERRRPVRLGTVGC